MRQVVAIHGGDAFATREEYLQFLREYQVDSIDYFKRTADWKANLQAALGNEYEVLLPQLPNKWDAKYEEWSLWFGKLFPFLGDDVVLIGHSLGASFLAKYLAGNRLAVRASAVMLVSGPYDTDGDRKLVQFDMPESLSMLNEQTDAVFLYHSKDDPVVPFTELAKYEAALPSATVRVFEDRGHFNQESFPELVADIRSLG